MSYRIGEQQRVHLRFQEFAKELIANHWKYIYYHLLHDAIL
jgi:hypothetical protein